MRNFYIYLSSILFISTVQASSLEHGSYYLHQIFGSYQVLDSHCEYNGEKRQPSPEESFKSLRIHGHRTLSQNSWALVVTMYFKDSSSPHNNVTLWGPEFDFHNYYDNGLHHWVVSHKTSLFSSQTHIQEFFALPNKYIFTTTHVESPLMGDEKLIQCFYQLMKSSLKIDDTPIYSF